LIDAPDTVIIDARPAARFRGDQPEPRAGLRSGHIPGSVSLPSTTLLNENSTLLRAEELKLIFDELGIHQNTQLVTTCGSGVTAAVICLALTCAGYENVALYDGSWSEWGALAHLPVVTGS
jgi:thiosulfate/3-mercaptopyruvate sulfurtransferase